MGTLNLSEGEEKKKPESMSMVERLQARSRVSPSARARSKDMLRLVLIVGAAILVLGGMIYLNTLGAKFSAPRSAPYTLPRSTQIPTSTEDDFRWDGVIAKFPDSLEEPDPAAEIDVNDPKFHHLLLALNRMPVETVRKGIEKDGEDLLRRFEETNGEKPRFPRITLARMPWDYPAVSRGKYFRIEGKLLEIYSLRINYDSPNLPKDVYMGVLEDQITRRAIHFYTSEQPRRADGSRFKTKQVKAGGRIYDIIDRGWVQIEGIFVNLRLYESHRVENRKNVRMIGANFIARTCSELPPPPPPADIGGGLLIIMGIVGVIIGGLVILANVMGRRYSSGSLRVRTALLRQERKRTASADGPQPAPSGASPPSTPPEDWKSIVE
jgi:hypothetical protein